MAEYRVYLLDGDNKIASACWVEALTLQTAIAQVSEDFSCICEIWEGVKRLAIVQPRVSDLPSSRS